MGGILVVDDSLTVRMDLSDAFESAGLGVRLAATLADARAALLAESFDLVLLDVNLPDGDGIAFLAEIKGAQHSAHIPVMLLSSESEVHDRTRGLVTGADEYVGKPYDAQWIVGRAREMLEQRTRATDSTILVVDDSPTFRAVMEDALRANGYPVACAATGEEGLRLAAALRPAAMIIDGMMPGIDGATVVRRLRLDAVLRNTPCLLLTANDAPDAESHALDTGADAYLRKEDDTRPVMAWLTAVLRASGPSTQVSTPSLHGPKRLLAVDDSVTFLRALSDRLRHEGYDVVVARSGEEALQALSVQLVDAILLDVVMPGLSGEETCRRIKDDPRLRDVPLIMLAAFDVREAMVSAINAGADDYIAKAADFSVLASRLRALLRRRQFEVEARRMRDELVRKHTEAAEARAARELAEVRAALMTDLERNNAELAAVNRELEAFSYSVSHDLRTPLRAIDGFARALEAQYGDRLDDQGQDYLRRVLAASTRMANLIDDLLNLARVTRVPLRRQRVDVSEMARTVFATLLAASPACATSQHVDPDLTADADAGLLRIVFENLLGNAWKFTAASPHATIDVGMQRTPDERVYCVRDNGPGFDMGQASKLFRPFQRLSNARTVEGTGIGLATVRRIVERHGGRVWAEAAPGAGAAFYFTLGPADRRGGAP